MNIPLEIPDQDIVVCVRIPGEPQAWLRAGRSGRRTFNPKENVAARDHLRWVIKTRHPEYPEHMDCVNRFGAAWIVETSKWETDIDNYEKQINDSLQGFVMKNDRQIDEVFKRVLRGCTPANLQLIVYRTKCSLGGKRV